MQVAIGPDDISQMFAGLTKATIRVVLGDLQGRFATAIDAINATGISTRELSPPPKLIMNAFHLTPVERTRVVIIGQDPYIRPGEAMGLSFSLPAGMRLTPSLRNIYKCLEHNGFIEGIDDAKTLSGDLTSWAKQGVLLLNMALTTLIGKSGEHIKIWKDYMSGLISTISKSSAEPLVFILWGKKAQALKPSILGEHYVFEWCHPSPLSAENKKADNPGNFIYCDSFAKTCEVYPINWGSVVGIVPAPDDSRKSAAAAAAVCGTSANGTTANGTSANSASAAAAVCSTTSNSTWEVTTDKEPLCKHKIFKADLKDTLCIFTDGGATANGEKSCKAAWGCFAVSPDGRSVTCGGPIPCSPEGIAPSNNRAEMTAIANALAIISQMGAEKVQIVSDSDLCVKTLTSYAPKWVKNEKSMAGKKNLDIIIPAYNTLVDLRKSGVIVDFKHVRSHLKEPPATDTSVWFYWKGNDIVDKEATRQIRLI